MNRTPLVLIVEDDPYLTLAYKTKFEREGIPLATAKTGQEGLDMMRQQKPNVIILDLMLPGKSGFEVLKEMREDPNVKDIPVVVLTVRGHEEDVRRTIALGAREYYIKTETKLDDILQTIKKYLPQQ